MNPRSRFESDDEYLRRLEHELDRTFTELEHLKTERWEQSQRTGYDDDEGTASDATIERAEACAH